MANTTVKISGLRELEKALADLPKATGKNTLRRVLRARAEPIAEAARAAAPDDPTTQAGDLKSGITVGTKLSKRQARLHRKMFKNDKAAVEMFAGAGPDPAAHNQEFGNINHPAQPFMRPAWDGEKLQVLDGIADDLWTEINKAAARLAKKRAKAASNGG